LLFAYTDVYYYVKNTMIPQIISIACLTELQSPIISNMYHHDSQFDFVTAFWAD